MFAGMFEQEDEGQVMSSYVPPPPGERPEHGMVGLMNQGTTCYLNSLLQTMYLTHELRWGLHALVEEELGAEELRAHDREEAERERAEEEAKKAREAAGDSSAGGEAAADVAPKDEFKEDPAWEGLVRDMAEAGFPAYHVVLACRTNATLLHDKQELFMWLIENPLPDDWEAQEQREAAAAAALAGASSEAPSDAGEGGAGAPARKRVKYRRIPLRLRELFAEMEHLNVDALSTQALTTSFGWRENHVGGQHDVTELNRVLFDALHRSLAGTSGSSLVERLYRGTIVNRLWCLGCDRKRDRPEHFQDLVLPIHPTLALALENYVQPAFLTGRDKYDCDECVGAGKGRQDAYMGASIREGAPVLTFNLQRLGMNYETNRRVKYSDELAFPLELDITPYCTDAVLDRTRRQHELRGSSDGPESAAVGHSGAMSNGGEGGKRNGGKRGGKKGGKKAKRELIPSDISDGARERGMVYELLSVVVHSGNPYGGHYYSLTRDRTNRLAGAESEEENIARSSLGGSWFCFNDSKVTPVEERSLADEYGGKTSHSAYMLIYVRSSGGEQLAAEAEQPAAAVMERIARRNDEVLVEREEWARENAKITVGVRTLDCFEVKDNQITVPSAAQTEAPSTTAADVPFERADGDGADDDLSMLAALSDLERIAAEEEQQTQRPEHAPSKGVLSLRIDRSTPLKEFLAMAVDSLRVSPSVSALEVSGKRARLDKYRLKDARVRLVGDLSELALDDQWQSEKSLEDLGVHTGDAMLLWTGTEATLSRTFNLEVRFFAEAVGEDGAVPEPEVLFCEVRDTQSVASLKRALEELTALDAGEMLLCRDDGDSVRVLKDDAASLDDVGVDESVCVTVEELVWESDEKKRPVSVAIQQFDERENQLVLELTNETGSGDGTLKIACTKDTTVDELKVLVASELGGAGTVEELAVLWPNGMEMAEGERSLMSFSVGGDTKLTVRLRSAIDDSIEVQFVTYLEQDSSERRQERNEIVLQTTVSASATVETLKQRCIEVWTEFSGDATNGRRSYRLRRMNFMKEMREILQEEKKTLSDVEVFDQDLVCLEEGRVPVPGEVTVSAVVYTWVPPAEAEASLVQLSDRFLSEELAKKIAREELEASADKATDATGDKAMGGEDPAGAGDPMDVESTESLAVSGNNDNLTMSERGGSAETATPGRTDDAGAKVASDSAGGSADSDRKPLVPLSFYSPTLFRARGDMEWAQIPEHVFISEAVSAYASRTEPLSVLKEAIMEALQVNSGLFANQTRELLTDSTVGLRVWNGSRLLSRDQATLKKCGIGNGSTVLVQLVPGGDAIPHNGTLVYVVRWARDADGRAVPEAAGSGDGAVKAAPTVSGSCEFLGESVFVSDKATSAELHAHVAAVAEIPVEHLCVAKYFFHKKKWAVVSDEMVRGADHEKQTAKQKAAARNLRKNACNLSSGNVLVALDTRAGCSWETVERALREDARVPRRFEPTYEEVQRFINESVYTAHAGGGEEGGLRIDTGEIDGVPDF